MINGHQLELNPPPPPPEPRLHPTTGQRLTNRQRFEAFRRANPHVEKKIVEVGRDLLRRGFRTCGIKLIFERLRWLAAIETKSDGFTLNNTYAPFYARLVMENHEDLRGFFRLRESEADREV
jgi:hypothetical protein